MATEIINSELTETYYLDAYDEVIIKRSGAIVTDNELGLFNRSDSDFDISIQVMGRVQADLAGIVLASAPETEVGPDVRSYISVGESGSVSGQLGLRVYQGFGADIRVAGVVSGSYGGIALSAPDSTLRILGEVRGDGGTALEISSQVQSNPIGFASIFNAGTIESDDYVAVYFQDAGGQFRNTETVSGATGVYASGNQDLLIRNEGTIFASAWDGIDIGDGDELATINNSGVIDAKQNAIQLVGTDARIVNSGTFSGNLGLRVDGQGDLVLRNSGVIAGDTQAIFDHGDGDGNIVNQGLIAGEIEASDSHRSYQLTNHGIIAGDIRLGYGADEYMLSQTGTMTGGVYGGHGNDILIGNDKTDWLSGEAGDDWLRGRGGDDALNGGSGEDRLQGGAGADIIDGGTDHATDEGLGGRTDRLTGGEGADIFVFGEMSGRDRVVDFEDGTDILRLNGHVDGFDALTISDQNGNLLVQHDNGSIVLVGQAGLVLTQADFDFA